MTFSIVENSNPSFPIVESSNPEPMEDVEAHASGRKRRSKTTLKLAPIEEVTEFLVLGRAAKLQSRLLSVESRICVRKVSKKMLSILFRQVARELELRQ